MTGKQLIRVRPYHAAGPEAAPVWHDRADCESGRWIRSRALRAGTRGFQRCPECARLESLDPIDPERSGAAAITETVPKVSTNPKPTIGTLPPPGRSRPRFTTITGILACAAIAILAILWQTGRLQPLGTATTKASIAASTTKAPRKVATNAKADPAAAARALAALRAAAPPTGASHGPTIADSATGAGNATEVGASYWVGSDGYTHGTESDGEPCSDNPDDPLFPCAHMVPGSDGTGSPLPDGGSTAGASGTAPAARAQRRQARQLTRTGTGR